MAETTSGTTSGTGSTGASNDAGGARGNWLLRIDRRLVYLFVFLALALPLVLSLVAPLFARKVTLKPAPLPKARELFDRVELLVREREEAVRDGREYDKIVLVVADFGPETRAELLPMLDAVVRHLMMRRIKFAIMTEAPQGAYYCKTVPEKLGRALGCKYGADWANFGFKPGGLFLINQMTRNLPAAIKTDEKGTKLTDEKEVAEKLPCLKGIKDAANVSLVVTITGYVSVLDQWISFFANDRARPDQSHGCTSISITDSITYVESGQLVGLLEGIAGAAAYNEFLEEARSGSQPHPSADARVHMTSQTVAHLLIVLFVALGNAGVLVAWLRRRREARA